MRRLLLRPTVRRASAVSLLFVSRSCSTTSSDAFTSAFPLTGKSSTSSSSSSSSSSFLFEACYVLNLDRRKDRWQHVLKQIQKHKLANYVRPITADNNNTANNAATPNQLFEKNRIQRVSGVDGISMCCDLVTTAPSSSSSSANNNTINHTTSASASSSPPPSQQQYVPSEAKLSALVSAGVITSDAKHRLMTIPNDQKLFGMDLTPGGVGCALGHMLIWEQIAAYGGGGGGGVKGVNNADDKTTTPDAPSSSASAPSPPRNFLILEDDVEFSPNFFRTLRARLSEVPSDYEVLYFGGLDLLNNNGTAPRPFVRDGVRYAYGGHRELTAYVVRDSGVARRMLTMSRPMQWQIDTHITERTRPCPLSSLSSSSPPSSSSSSSSSDQGTQIIADPLSYALQPSLAIQVTSYGTDVQKQPSQNPNLEDASRRLREFVAGGTSVR